MSADVAKPYLFVCTFNSIRSPMAANIYAHLSGGQPVASAGVEMRSIHPMVFAAMYEADMAKHLEEGELLEDLDLEDFGTLVALSRPAHEALTRAGAAHHFWDMEDFEPAPVGEVSREEAIAPFVRLRHELETRMRGSLL